MLEDRIEQIVRIKQEQRKDFYTNLSPVDLLKEELHMERRVVMEAFQFAKSQEYQYMKKFREMSDQLIKEKELSDLAERRKNVRLMGEWEQQHKERMLAHYDRRVEEIKLEQSLSEQKQSMELNFALGRVGMLENEVGELEQKIERYNVLNGFSLALSRRLNSWGSS